MNVTRRETLVAAGTTVGVAETARDAGTGDEPANADNSSDGAGIGNGNSGDVTAEVIVHHRWKGYSTKCPSD